MKCCNGDAMIVGLLLNYRQSNRTLRCIDNLFSKGVDYVVVVENSDDDGVSFDFIRKKLSVRNDVEIINGGGNLGFSAGVNCGIFWIKNNLPLCQYVLLINNDAVILEEGVSDLVAILDESPQSVIAFPQINHNGTVLGRMYVHRLTGLLSSKKYLGSFFYCSGCCFLIALNRLTEKLFDEKFFMYGEDWELGWRLGEKRIVFLPKTLVFHEGSVSSGVGSYFYEYSLVVAHLKIIENIKNGTVDLVVLWVVRLIMLLVRAVIRTLRFRSILPLKALLFAIKILLK